MIGSALRFSRFFHWLASLVEKNYPSFAGRPERRRIPRARSTKVQGVAQAAVFLSQPAVEAAAQMASYKDIYTSVGD